MTAPVWGCPWHGLVTNGQLALSNGQSMAWPLGGPDRWYGDTHLVRAPGVAEIVRTPEEAAADAAAGRQWRTTAILAGGQNALHGGGLNGWVYCASDGTRWHVPLTGLPALAWGAQWSGNFSVRRFGVLGGAPDVRSFPFSVDPGQPALDPVVDRPPQVRLHAVAEDGAWAVLEVFMPVGTRYWQTPFYELRTLFDAPVGFLRVELSGGAEDLALTIATLYDQAETLGESYYNPVAEWQYEAQGETYTANGGAGSCGATGRIIAVWEEGGQLVPVTASIECSSVLDNPPYSGVGTRTCTVTETVAVTLRAGARVIDVINGGGEGTRVVTFVDDVYQEQWDEQLEFAGRTWGGEGSGNTTRPFANVAAWFEGWWFGEDLIERAVWPARDFYLVDVYRYQIMLFVSRYSNNTAGLRLRVYDYETDTAVFEHRSVGYPGGAAGAALTEPAPPTDVTAWTLRYSSYNPATGALVRNQTDPVCWV